MRINKSLAKKEEIEKKLKKQQKKKTEKKQQIKTLKELYGELKK